MVGAGKEPAWLRCLDIGSLRLTERHLDSDPPGQAGFAAVERAVEEAFDGLTPPLPLMALATGGTARSLRRIVGRRLGEKNLTAAAADFALRRASDLAVEHDVLPERARVLLAGTLVLRAAHRRLGVKLDVAKGGVREGAVRGLLAELGEVAA